LINLDNQNTPEFNKETKDSSVFWGSKYCKQYLDLKSIEVFTVDLARINRHNASISGNKSTSRNLFKFRPENQNQAQWKFPTKVVAGFLLGIVSFLAQTSGV
jgi:hypothetical protein